MPWGLWVARLHISDRTAQKIISVHHITPDEVREARGETQYLYFDGTRPGDVVVTTVRAVLRDDRLPAG